MKTTIGAIGIAVVLIILGVVYSGTGTGSAQPTPSVNNVSVVDGKQVVVITAKGGYSPKVTNAKAGITTILRVDTNGTFDCSSAVAIPSLGYRKNLPMSGSTDIEIPPQKVGTKMQGLCAMGMYNFIINFN